jgi:3D (Asp-Asp-Asp) domain-containing protein
MDDTAKTSFTLAYLFPSWSHRFDAEHYPFGTIMDIPGYGRGIVEDRGSAIKGPNRIDLFLIHTRKH